MDNQDSKVTHAITVRIPKSDYDRLKEYATQHESSLNAVVAEAIAEYTAKIERQSAIRAMVDFQHRLKERGGHSTDSVLLLRNIRESRTAGCAVDDTCGAEKAGESTRTALTELDHEDERGGNSSTRSCRSDEQ